ncbi:MAG TPA: 4-(cytidine 5'-diphospho)-2-C-methyl-D-erythritol kinase [Selenomonadales bacterium]|nr:4-(cytidine 5'-diphospho)-2-C-methyl-D-erythritol kinase [Selenomonadales bacterium]
MEQPIVVAAHAKINLALDVLGKREDGYHEVAMVMQSVGLADRVALSERPEGIRVSTDLAGLDCGPANLAYRAAELLQKQFAIRRGVEIVLAKHIPLAAGLAGGSADAAAVLQGLNRLWELELPEDELVELGALLGSDVPFCLEGGTMLATGRGESLAPLPALPHAWLVLAKPPVAVSTAWVYGQFRPEAVAVRPDLEGMAESLRRGDLPGVAGRLCNVLETVTIPVYPEIAAIKQLMLKHGAMASLMSGSGPTVFGLAATREKAEEIAAVLEHSGVGWVAVTETIRELGEKS